MSELDLMLSRLSRPSESWDESEKRRTSERLQEILAESTASDVAVLRLALARVLVDNERMKTAGGGCHCAGKNSCFGHVTETTKIARAALGLPALPDTPRVETEPREPADDGEAANG
jgi:hypothetical protein